METKKLNKFMEFTKTKDNLYEVTFPKYPTTNLIATRNKDNCTITEKQTDLTILGTVVGRIKAPTLKGKWKDREELVIKYLNFANEKERVVFKSKEDAVRFFYHKLNKPTLASIDNALFFAYGWYRCFIFYGGYRSGCLWGGSEMGSVFDAYPLLIVKDATFKPTSNGIHESVLDKFFKNGVPNSVITKPFDNSEFDLSSYHSNYSIHSAESLRDEVILFLDDVVDYLNRTNESVLTNEIKNLPTWQYAWNNGKSTINLINEFLLDDFLAKASENPFGR